VTDARGAPHAGHEEIRACARGGHNRGCTRFQSIMRLIVRFMVLVVAVFGLGLAFAWAWDSSDPSAVPPTSNVASH
jgi:hypothetical protein